MSLHKRRNVMKAFLESEFGHCPFHGHRSLNNSMDKLHDRALRLVYRDETSAYEDLLRKDGSSKIHHRNIHKLANEIFKFKNGLSPPIMNDFFINGKTHNYNLRQEHINDRGNIRHVFNRTDTVPKRHGKWYLNRLRSANL